MTKRFGMYQNTLYDDGDILNPFNAMKLLNHFDKENTKLKEENKQLKSKIKDYDVALKKLQDLTDKKLKENEQLKGEVAHYKLILMSLKQEAKRISKIR